jgi:hypothetical protein
VWRAFGVSAKNSKIPNKNGENAFWTLPPFSIGSRAPHEEGKEEIKQNGAPIPDLCRVVTMMRAHLYFRFGGSLWADDVTAVCFLT